MFKKYKNCLYCGKEFEIKRWDLVFTQKFCSNSCEIDFKRKTYKGLLKLRFEILKRDNFKCQYCGRNVKEDGVKLQIDHIQPKNKGGTDNPENLITSCFECNLGKSDVLLENRKYSK